MRSHEHPQNAAYEESDAGGTKRREKHVIRKVGVSGSCSGSAGPRASLVQHHPDSLLCVGYVMGTQHDGIPPVPCEGELPTARCQDLQGHSPLCCIRLRSGSAG